MPQHREDTSCSRCDSDIYDITQQQRDYVTRLPMGIKLILPDGRNYLLFHNEPNDLWSFNREINQKQFLNKYPIDKKTRAVIKGHFHENIIVDFPEIPCKLITVGHLCNSDHHSGQNNGANYAILSENGIEFKKI
jgi:hypothetical protein